MRLHHHLLLVDRCQSLLACCSYNSTSILVVGSWSQNPWPQSTQCSWTVQVSAHCLYVPNLCPRLEEPPRIGWHESVSCYHHGWHSKRSRLFLFSAIMPKPPQDYQVVVLNHCYKEDKSYHTFCGSGSSRWRRSYWIFFCTPTHCGTSTTTTKSSRNQIIIQSHIPVISLSILTTPNFIKWSPLMICNLIGRSYPDAILWFTGTTHHPITSQFPRLFIPWFPPFPYLYRSSIRWRRWQHGN